MQVLRRTVVGLFAASILLTLVGCGGLGVNIGSGAKGSDTVAKVTILVVSGPNIPIVLTNHTITLQAIAYDSRNFVSSTQGAIWTASGNIGLLDPTCTFQVDPVDANNGVTQTSTTPTQTICIFGGDVPDSSARRRMSITPQGISTPTPTTVTATVAGQTGQVDIIVQ